MPPTSAAATPRPRRDVERNLAALTEAAKRVFAASGVNAPAKEITDLAGVGVGTLYRHFPRRSDLIVAVLQQELDGCVAAADTLSATLGPAEAFVAWIDRFTELVATKQGLAEALHSADPAYDGLPTRLLAALEPALATLLDAGVRSDAIRPDVSAHEVLLAVALLCQPVPGEEPEVNRRLLRLFVEGLGRGDLPRSTAHRP